MLGSSLPTAWVDELGVLGDRAYALKDMDTGTVASAKHPRRWPQLLSCEAEYQTKPKPETPLPSVSIRLPTGEVVQGCGPATDTMLSGFFGSNVSLETAPSGELLRETDRTPAHRDVDGEIVETEPMGLGAPEGRYHDCGPIHILTTATLRTLAAHNANASFDRVRFRPNLLIDVDGDGFPENQWMG
ncbi:MAG: sulfurase, partial [Gemmatimonadetes bacterium]|nr:sulfurase [Gemmatimonadota bacterium]